MFPADCPTIIGLSSKLTRTLFFFLPEAEAERSERKDIASEASLVSRICEPMGDIVLGECPFMADFTGEAERASGWCLVTSSSGLSEKRADLAGLTD